MPSVTLYQMPQVIQLSESGALSSHAVVNRTDFNLFKNVTNEVEFLLKDVDRKPVSLANKTLTLFIVDERTGKLVIQNTLQVIDQGRGHCRMTLHPGELLGLTNGYFRYSVTIQRADASQVLVYTDQSRSLKGHLELFDGPIPSPQPIIEIEPSVFVMQTWGIPGMNYFVAEAFPGAAQTDNRSGQHTLAVYATDFSGKIWVEASLENSAPSRPDDWFPVADYTLSEYSGVKGVQFTGSYMWLRFYYQPALTNTGTINKALFKN